MKYARKLHDFIIKMEGIRPISTVRDPELRGALVNLKDVVDKAFTCPRCGGGIPNDEHRGHYPGALSRTDNETEICSNCGHEEAMEQFAPRGSGIREDRIKPQEEWWISSQSQS